MSSMSPAIAKRYAQALFASVVKSDQTMVLAQFLSLKQLWEADQKVRDFFIAPGTPASAKHRVLCQALAPRLVALLMLLLYNKRILGLPKVALAYEHEVLSAQGLQKVILSTASGLSEAEQPLWQERLRGLLGRPVLVEHEVVPSLLGGIRLQTDHGVLDWSVQRRLENLRWQLSKN